MRHVSLERRILMILNLIKIILILWIVSIVARWYNRLVSQHSRERFSPPPPQPSQEANTPPNDIIRDRIEEAEFEEVEKKP